PGNFSQCRSPFLLSSLSPSFHAKKLTTLPSTEKTNDFCGSVSDGLGVTQMSSTFLIAESLCHSAPGPIVVQTDPSLLPSCAQMRLPMLHTTISSLSPPTSFQSALPTTCFRL